VVATPIELPRLPANNLIALKEELALGNRKALARLISLLENNQADAIALLQELTFSEVAIVGITGPPGAGKSTLINALCSYWLNQGEKVGIVAVDPSSPFNRGAIMGDRLRMSEHFLHPNLFIRSMASRGNLGGLSPRIFEVCDLYRAAGFDRVIIETVGVGQSEVEIAALADTTVLVLVPEAGDDIQTIKSGIMEIGEIFVLNKSDRAGADTFYKNLKLFAHTHADAAWESPVIKTVAHKQEGIAELALAIDAHKKIPVNAKRKLNLLAQRALLLIATARTKEIQLEVLESEIEQAMLEPDFNLYKLIAKYLPNTN